MAKYNPTSSVKSQQIKSLFPRDKFLTHPPKPKKNGPVRDIRRLAKGSNKRKG